MPRVRLTPAEHAELARLCRDPERFHSDGREVLWGSIDGPLLCVPPLAVLWGDVRSELRQLQSGEMTLGTGLLFQAPELIGFVVLLAVAAGVAAYGIRTFRRHGVVITTFGVARVRGGVKKLIRYAEIERVTFGERTLPKHSVITDELEVKAKDGRVIMLYGFGLGQRQRLIEEEMRQGIR